MSISEMTILKSLAYDEVVKLDQAKSNLTILQAKIAKLAEAITPATEELKE